MVTLQDAIRLSKTIMDATDKFAEAPQPSEVMRETLEDIREWALQFLINAGEIDMQA